MTICMSRAEQIVCREYSILSLHYQIMASTDILIICAALCKLIPALGISMASAQKVTAQALLAASAAVGLGTGTAWLGLPAPVLVPP